MTSLTSSSGAKQTVISIYICDTIITKFGYATVPGWPQMTAARSLYLSNSPTVGLYTLYC